MVLVYFDVVYWLVDLANKASVRVYKWSRRLHRRLVCHFVLEFFLSLNYLFKTLYFCL